MIVDYHMHLGAPYDLEKYVDSVVEAKRRGHAVKLGLEVDYQAGLEEETAEVLAPYPWDYLIGSIHFLDGRAINGEPSLVDAIGVEEAWRLKARQEPLG